MTNNVLDLNTAARHLPPAAANAAAVAIGHGAAFGARATPDRKLHAVLETRHARHHGALVAAGWYASVAGRTYTFSCACVREDPDVRFLQPAL